MEKKIPSGKNAIVAGLDEAGRGSWAGPVVAAAVILPDGFDVAGLRDSKLLTRSQRERLFERITASCPFGVGMASNRIIDRIGIKRSTRRAMLSAIRALPSPPSELLVDGNDGFAFTLRSKSIIRGDVLVPAISAASIVAKVWRDCLLMKLHKRWPLYGFALHKGYGTALHARALKKHGPCRVHRLSFAPVQASLKGGL